MKSSSSSSSSVASSSSSAATVGNATNGLTLYTTAPLYCSSCHGADGKSTANTNGKIIDPSKTDYSGKTLAQYITANMPLGGIGKCDAQCSLDIAAYIKTWSVNAITESVSSPAVSNTTHTISLINDCGKGVTAPTNGYKFIGDYDTAQSNQAVSLSGWNKITSGVTEWANTKFYTNANTYIIPSNGKANSTCNNVDTTDMVLVKKYADWSSQHSNGLAPTGLNIKFGNIASIVMDIKVNSARTSLLSQDALVSKYKSADLPESNIRALDKGYVNLGFTFEAQDSTLSASDIIEINQTMFQDQWIRVVIDMSKVKYCSATNGVCTVKTAADFANTTAVKFLLVAETGAGGTLRNTLWSLSDAQWAAKGIPESFKELDISIKKLEFIYK